MKWLDEEDSDWPRLLAQALREKDEIVEKNKLWAVSTDRQRELEEFAGRRLTWKEAAAWEYLLRNENYR
jgi:hypothetical protein